MSTEIASHPVPSPARFLKTQLELIRVLAEAQTVAEAAERIVGPVWQELGFDGGNLWIVDGASHRLNRAHGWFNAAMGVSTFDQASAQSTFAPGIGLPGRVWVSRKPTWISDVTEDDNFPRASSAAMSGLHAAAGFPVLHGEKVLGVLEFFSTRVREPDEELLALMGVLGGQIGQFIQRLRAQEDLRHSEAKFRAAVEPALDCIVGMDAAGNITEFTPAAERAFG